MRKQVYFFSCYANGQPLRLFHCLKTMVTVVFKLIINFDIFSCFFVESVGSLIRDQSSTVNSMASLHLGYSDTTRWDPLTHHLRASYHRKMRRASGLTLTISFQYYIDLREVYDCDFKIWPYLYVSKERKGKSRAKKMLIWDYLFQMHLLVLLCSLCHFSFIKFGNCLL